MLKTKEIPFMNALSKIVDNRGKTAPTTEEGIPLIATNCVSNDSLYPEFKDVRYVAQEIYDTWFRGHPKPNDILFVNKGSPGRVCLVPSPVDFVIAQDMVALRVNPDVTTPDFLLALLRTEEVQKSIVNMHVGTMIPHFKKGDFKHLSLRFPDLETQKKIGAVYRAFSDKIELNRQMNRTLEAMACTQFQSWFVDFDPVRAKMRGEEPEGMDAETAALFPDVLEVVEGREAPKGWEWTRLDSLLVLQRGFDLPATKRDSGNFPVFSAGGLHGFHSKPMVSGPGIVTGRSGVIGKVFFVPVDYWPLNTTLWIKEFKEIGPNYAFELLKNVNFSDFSAGSAVPTLNRNHIHCLQVVKPPARIAEEFEKMASDLRTYILRNEGESAQLSSIRDSLLPRLLSGELDVSDWTEVLA